MFFARFSLLQTIDVDEYPQPRDEYERFRAWFVDRVIDESYDSRWNYDPYLDVPTEPCDYEDQSSLFD